jgi:hypothetical protein
VFEPEGKAPYNLKVEAIGVGGNIAMTKVGYTPTHPPED